jgi:hypothetical protein
MRNVESYKILPALLRQSSEDSNNALCIGSDGQGSKRVQNFDLGGTLLEKVATRPRSRWG